MSMMLDIIPWTIKQIWLLQWIISANTLFSLSMENQHIKKHRLQNRIVDNPTFSTRKRLLRLSSQHFRENHVTFFFALWYRYSTLAISIGGFLNNTTQSHVWLLGLIFFFFFCTEDIRVTFAVYYMGVRSVTLYMYN